LVVRKKGEENLLKACLFAVAMAYLEAAVVTYLRQIFYPEGFSFPLKVFTGEIMIIELGREVASIAMLALVA